MDSIIDTRPCRLDDIEQLTKNAAVDDHTVWFPQFVHVKNGELVGYFSIMPMVVTWQDTKKFKPTDTLKGIGFIEGVLAGQQRHCFPCATNSPYMSFLPKAGYVKYTEPVELFIKQINMNKEAK
jgi:hypothetical protein